MNSRTTVLLCIVVLGVLTGCRQLTLDRNPVDVQRNEITTGSGLRYEDLFVGDGAPAKTGDVVVFDYTAWLEDGRRVDSTEDRGLPLEVTIGEAPLAGWNEGLGGMRRGGRRKMWVPPTLAYGSEGVPGLIPPDATLVFEVHLIEIRP